MIEEERIRQTNILVTILRFAIFFLGLSEIVIIIDYLTHRTHYHGISIVGFSLIWLTFVALYVLTKRGFSVVASHLLVFILFMSACYGAYLWGADLQGVLLGFVITISISTILLGNRYGFFVTSAVILAMAVFWYLQIASYIFPDRSWRIEISEYEDITSYMLLILLIMSVSWLSNSEIHKSLKRARQSEEDLRVERDNLEIKVDERTKELRQAQAEKLSQLYRFSEFGRLASGIFHDLLNPLSAVMLNLTEVRKGTDLAPTTKTYLDNADKISRQMESFMQTVRKQIQTTEVEKYFSPNDEIKDILTVLNFRIAKSKTELVFHSNKDISLYGRALKFYQVLTNIIGNALDALEEKADGRRVLTIKLTEKEFRIIVTVTDTGPGIPADILPHIFEPFFTTKSAEKGTGIGLSTAKEIVETNFKGSIQVTSSKTGTGFTLIFPKHASESLAQAD